MTTTPSDLFARCLVASGVRRVFGMPGEDIAPLWSALASSPEIELVMCRHELGAAAMACTHARLTGELSVCLAPGGPGASNMLTALANARVDGLPVLVVTGAGGNSEVEPLVDRALAEVVKESVTVGNVAELCEVVAHAAGSARSPRRGPCRVVVPCGILEGQIDELPMREPAIQPLVQADAASLDDLASRLAAARFPGAVAGRFAAGAKAVKALRRLSDRSGMPVTATAAAKGAVDMDSEASLLTLAPPVDGPVRAAVLESDLVVTIGLLDSELPPDWMGPEADGRVVHLDGDLQHALAGLGERLGERPLAGAERIAAVRRAVLDELDAHAEDDVVGRIDPRKVVGDLRAVLGPHDILVADVGAHGLWLQNYYLCHEPRTCVAPSAFRPMGTALPGAIAARLAFPDRNVVAVCGDGTLLVNAQEMETARRLGSNVTVVVWVDDAFGLVSLRGGGNAVPMDTSFGNPDFVALAESFGWRGVLCDRASDLRDILRKEVEVDEPSLVAVPVDYSDTAHLLGRG